MIFSSVKSKTGKFRVETQLDSDGETDRCVGSLRLERNCYQSENGCNSVQGTVSI